MNHVKEVIKEKYGAAATRASAGEPTGCGCGCSPGGGSDPITGDLYNPVELTELPEGCKVSAGFRLGMKRLDSASLKKEVGDYLSGAQIGALLARRNGILKACG